MRTRSNGLISIFRTGCPALLAAVLFLSGCGSADSSSAHLSAPTSASASSDGDVDGSASGQNFRAGAQVQCQVPSGLTAGTKVLLGTAASETITVPAFNGAQNFYVNGCGGSNVLVLSTGDASWYTMSAAQGVITVRDIHATGSTVTAANIQVLQFPRQVCYSVGSSSLSAISCSGVPVPDPSVAPTPTPTPTTSPTPTQPAPSPSPAPTTGVIPPAPSAGDTLVITNASSAAVSNYPLQVGRPFVQGEIANYPQILVNGTAILTQADVKQRHADGSVKHAILSAMIPSLPAGGSVTLTFRNQGGGNNTPLTAAQMQDPAYNFDAVISIASSTGSQAAASALQMLQQGKFTYWTSGPIATTVLLADDSSSRVHDLGFDSYKPIRPRFYATFWPATHQVLVRFIGENSNTQALENVTYDLSLTAGLSSPQPVFSQNSVNHSFLTRWTKTFWINGAPAQQIDINHNLAYLAQTRFLPNYDTTLKVPDSVLANEYAAWQNSAHTQINDPGLWTTYMPTTGGRDDIGPVTTWAARWLYTGDWRAREVTLGQANLAAAWPIHAREGNAAKKIDKAQTLSGLGLPISHYAYSNVWFPDNNGSYGAIALSPRASSCVNYAPPCWVVDGAHQPDPFYAQYILTGDYFYLEEMQMWAGMMTLAYSPGYSGNTVGIIDQVRGDAWVFRNRMNAAFATPDDETTLKAFFNQITDDALAFWEGQASITGGSFQGAAEWQWAHANSHLPTNPLHFWGSNSGAPYTDATWMHYYFITTLGMATERGFASGPMLSYVGTVLTNQAVAANYNPYNIATYWINTSDPSGNWYPDWSSIQTANVALGYMHATGDFGVTSNGDPTYVMLATGAASYLTHEPNGSAAWSFLNQNFRQPALQGGLGSGVYKDGTGEINWNILPRP